MEGKDFESTQKEPTPLIAMDLPFATHTRMLHAHHFLVGKKYELAVR